MYDAETFRAKHENRILHWDVDGIAAGAWQLLMERSPTMTLTSIHSPLGVRTPQHPWRYRELTALDYEWDAHTNGK